MCRIVLFEVGFSLVPVTRKGQLFWTKVDDDIAEWASGLALCYSKGYAHFTASKGKQQRLHRAIMGEPEGAIDHINGDPLDNRRRNLRLATHAQNMMNRKQSKHSSQRWKGVNFDKRKARWRARITVGGVTYRSKYVKDPIEAARLYNEMALRHHGAFARLNDLD